METVIVIGVAGLLTIAAATVLATRTGVATPLLLVAVGALVSFAPGVPPIDVEPEWILSGVLPPLLYAAAVAVPPMEFRRDLRAIAGLSVVLVVATAVVVGGFLAWAVPGLGWAWGIALGAIVSPTDAVATRIVKRLGVSPRVVAILEGEGLLNDATALIVLRTAIAATAVAVSPWAVVGDFAYAVAVAVFVGAVVGRLNLRVRARLTDAPVSTVVSFTAPFAAAVPAELLGASGLVAAVVAGLVTGYGAPRALPPLHRVSDRQNWQTVELVLEGTIFLLMGLELATILAGAGGDRADLELAALVAAGVLLLTIVIRTAYVAPLLWALRVRARRGLRARPRFVDLQDQLDDPDAPVPDLGRGPVRPDRIEQFRTRLRRAVADIDYFVAEPLGPREGAVVVWAGMRGAITLAAAQTLPDATPQRSVLVLVAFLVATGSLLVQGGLLPRVVAWVAPARERVDPEELVRIAALLDEAAATVAPPDPAMGPEGVRRAARQVIDAQRGALLDAREHGIFSGASLDAALVVLDADQISLELKGRSGDPAE